MPLPRLILLATLSLLAACGGGRHRVDPEPAPMSAMSTLVPAQPTDVGMSAQLGMRLEALARRAIAEGTAPGVAIAVGRHGRLVHFAGYGTLDWADGSPAVDGRSLYDLASLTKVVATTTTAMILEEEGRLALDSAVALYVPEFAALDSLKRPITVRMLLTHVGGLEAGAPLWRTARGREQYLNGIATRPLKAPPGSETIYSDWDMVVLQLVLERITGQPLDRFAAERIFGPLGMTDTGFLPDTLTLAMRLAPTAVDSMLRGGLLRGVVHDTNAWAMGGVSGHAGLFSSARDLSVFAQMLLNGGTYGGWRVVRPETLARWLAPQGRGSSRALGWDTPSPTSSAGLHFSPRSFGHTGFTGTSLWVDPERGLFVVLLANRVSSRGASGGHAALRRDVADAVQRSILDAPLVRWEEPER
ncbi:MAG TPA: serine hydrolase [Gemmatimonadaceae bacterium]|jgi:CubicO group peptidase (beta-lactamase class C family)|nr:serine hydrolase [Gemmatimonadaceae bacterium]